jgi:hypothetical protein
LETVFFPNSRFTDDGLSYPTYEYFRDKSDVFAGLAAHDEVTVNIRFGDDD